MILFDSLQTRFQGAVRRGLVLAGLGSVLAAGVISWLISRRMLAPVRRIGEASTRIAEGHYEDRIPVAPGGDELADLTRSFNQMAESLNQIEAMRRQLIADVSHELKTPLASIKGYMEGLQDGVIPASPETYQLVHHEADRLQRLVFDLQELSRAEAAQMPLHPVPVDAGALQSAAVDFLRPQFESKGVALHADPPAAPITVYADFDRARQVIINVLGNALQYTPPGGAVTIRASRNGQEAHFEISDTGVGLAAEDLTRVFQRFYRVDKSRSRAGGGSGIGLTIARHIAEAHGGGLSAHSQGIGKGSTFTLTLPLV
jgi:histidine kinase